MSENSKEKIYIGLSFLILIIFLSPYFINASDSRFLIHDNLNSNVVWFFSLGKSPYFFGSSDQIVPFVFNGVPRGCYPSEFNMITLLFSIFPPLTAYCINMVLLHLIAFAGTFVFFNKYILKEESTIVKCLVSLCYAMLPFYPSGGISIAGMPLLLYAFLNFYCEESDWKDWAIILLFPLYSSVIFSNLFFTLTFGFVYLILILFRKATFKLKVIIPLILFGLLTVVVEYRLFEMQFLKHFVSHRSLFENSPTLNVKGLIGLSVKHFIWGQYHFPSLHILILILSLYALFKGNKTERISILLIMVLMYCISLIYISKDSVLMGNVFKALNMKNSMQLRFISLFPLLSILLFAFSIQIINKHHKRYIVYGLLIIQVVFVMFLPLPRDYEKCEFLESPFYFNKINTEYASFTEYYKKTEFEQIKKDFVPGNYNILCLGFEPGVAQFNGYNTIDGYFYYFPVEKVDMIKKIAGKCTPENKITIRNTIYIDNLIQDKNNIDCLDTHELSANNCKYIFSTTPLKSDKFSLIKAYNFRNFSLNVYNFR